MSCGARIIADLDRLAYIRHRQGPLGLLQPDGERHECHRFPGRQRQICADHRSLQGRSLGHRQGRHQRAAFDASRKYLPDGLSLAGELALSPTDMRFISQIQGRTYANIFGLVERFITAKLIDVSGQHAWATRLRWRPWCASATRRLSTRSCSGASKQ